MSKPIFVVGYPKSGTTWLTRLLGDVLNAPTGGACPKVDRAEIAAEGFDRESEYIVRKGHYVIQSGKNWKKDPHFMSLSTLLNNPTVCIVRDPRDVVISAMYYWRTNLPEMVRRFTSGSNNFRHMGSWNAYTSSWISKPVILVRYEDLLSRGEEALSLIVQKLGFEVTSEDVSTALTRQAFSARKAHVEKHGDDYPLGKGLNLRFMRKGVAGDWKTHFTRSSAFAVETHCSSLFEALEYESDRMWWKKL